jgi:uncharacterized repeat protein (TIGR03803 family)
MRRMKFTTTAVAALALTAVALIPSAWARSKERVLHTFSSNGPIGYNPDAGLIIDAAGNLYGTTTMGGNRKSGCRGDGCGTVFSLTRGVNGEWTGKVLHSFPANSRDGAVPQANLIFDGAGNLYGTTSSVASIAFKLIPRKDGSWIEKVLHTFGNGKDGRGPSSLVFDASGNLFGATTGGGAYGYGSIFELTPTANGHWTEKVLYSFNGKDGYDPFGVVIDKAGNLYGTTYFGGANACMGTGCGMVFELSPGSAGKWTERILHSFNDDGEDGFYPDGGLIFDLAGNLYGTTFYGGTGSGCFEDGCGTVFELTPDAHGHWTESVLHNFNPRSQDGYFPVAGLVFDSFGNLYGTTFAGGTYQYYGTVFELTPGTHGHWAEKLLHSFNDNGRDGYGAVTGLIVDTTGKLYGTTYQGGTQDLGTVFEITP